MSREYPERPIVGIGAVVFSDAGVLMIRRGKAPRIGSWSLPGGAQKLGETIFEAAYREVLEETGVEIDILGIADALDSISRDENGGIRYHYTLVDVVADARPTLPRPGGDALEAAWRDPDALEDMALWSETTRVIALARDMWETSREIDGV